MKQTTRCIAGVIISFVYLLYLYDGNFMFQRFNPKILSKQIKKSSDKVCYGLCLVGRRDGKIAEMQSVLFLCFKLLIDLKEKKEAKKWVHIYLVSFHVMTKVSFETITVLSLEVNSKSVDKCPDTRPWINSCDEQWYVRVFWWYAWYFHKNSVERKCGTTRYNAAKLSQPKQNIVTPVCRDMAHENVVNTKRVRC